MESLRVRSSILAPELSFHRLSVPLIRPCAGPSRPRILPVAQQGVNYNQYPDPYASPPSAASPYPTSPDSSYGSPPSSASEDRLGAAARLSLTKASGALSRYGWLAFWVQLVMSVVSAGILLFSVAFTSSSGPKAALYLTLIGIITGFLSAFHNNGYTRMGKKLKEFLDGVAGAKIKKKTVVDAVTRGVYINLAGMLSTLIGISALVGTLVAKTLANASTNPFMVASSNSYRPVLALDVFLVQAATNIVLGHFLSLCASLWLLSVMGDGGGSRGKADGSQASGGFLGYSQTSSTGFSSNNPSSFVGGSAGYKVEPTAPPYPG